MSTMKICPRCGGNFCADWTIGNEVPEYSCLQCGHVRYAPTNTVSKKLIEQSYTKHSKENRQRLRY